MNYLCLRPCVLWHFLHFFILGKSHCQSETVSMVTFYNWIKFLKNIVGMAMWFLDNYIHKLMILYWPSFFGQDGWIFASFFFCVFMDLDFVSVHKNAKEELGQYPAILTSRLVNNAYFLFFSVRERAVFNKSCNLIGSGSGRNFLIRPGHGGRNR